MRTAKTPKITKDGFYALTDEFILANAPYESNFGEVLNWSDHPDYVIKNSVKGDGTEGSVDRIVTDVNAVQSKKNVFANFRTTPTGEYQTISIPYGSNYEQSENMLAIKAAEAYGGKPFAYWEVRKTENGAVVAKSYEPQAPTAPALSLNGAESWMQAKSLMPLGTTNLNQTR